MDMYWICDGYVSVQEKSSANFPSQMSEVMESASQLSKVVTRAICSYAGYTKWIAKKIANNGGEKPCFKLSGRNGLV